MRIINKYDSNNLVNYEESYAWDAQENALIPQNKTYSINFVVFHDGIKAISSYWVERYSWDIQLKQWKGTSKNDYQFNKDGELTSATNYIWSNSTNDWIESAKSKTVYTYTGERLDKEQSYSWDYYDKKDWIPSGSKIYYYSKSATEILKPNEPSLKVQVIDNAIFLPESVKQVFVYSVSGSLITRTSERMVNLNGWTKGIYIVKIVSNDNREYSQKIIVN